jgi:hypothetical protein
MKVCANNRHLRQAAKRYAGGRNWRFYLFTCSNPMHQTSKQVVKPFFLCFKDFTQVTTRAGEIDLKNRLIL